MNLPPNLFTLALGLSLSSATLLAEELIRQDQQSLAELSDRITKGQSENAEIRVTSNSVPAARNPMRRSSVLTFNGKSTIVPAGSIIHLPERYADRVVSKPIGQLVSFPNFLRLNFGWLVTKEVAKTDSAGAPSPEKTTKETETSSNYVVVSTRHNSPISNQISSQ